METVPHPYLTDAPRPRVLAHRGLVTRELAEQGVAENSVRAIQAAVDAGVTFVESDCHLTADGVVVLFHDTDLMRVTGDPRLIADVTFAELQELMADRGRLATLESALEEFPDTRFNIDVKARDAAEPAGRIIAPHAHRVLLTSFSDAHRTRAVRGIPKDARPAASPGKGALIRILIATWLRIPILARLALAGFDALQIPERQGPIRVLTPRLIRAAHRAGVEVHVWTVNDTARMRELVAMGVDGIVTDRADAALAALPGSG